MGFASLVDFAILVVGAFAAFTVALVVLSRFWEPLAGEARAAALLSRLPRAWRDEEFYEELTPNRPTILTAIALVAAVGVALMASLALGDLSAGRSPVERLLGGAAGAIAAWLVLGTAAFGAARLAFGRHARWKKILVALGFALSPLLLAGFWSTPLGVLLVFAGLSATFLLCYLAFRALLPSDPMGTMGVTVSFLLTGMLVWVVTQTACVFCTGFSAFGCPATHPIKGVKNPDGAQMHYLPGSAGYDEVGVERCFSNARAASNAGYGATLADGVDCPPSHSVKAERTAEGASIYAYRGSSQYVQMRPERCFVDVVGALDAGYQAAPGLPKIDCTRATPVKAARDQSGQRLYYLPDSPSYDEISAEGCFATETQARSAGYRRG